MGENKSGPADSVALTGAPTEARANGRLVGAGDSVFHGVGMNLVGSVSTMSNQEIFEKARDIMHQNMVKSENGSAAPYHYTKPSPQRYPYQFFWDTCFHVFILASLGEHEMAKQHLISLFAKQQADGFVGHMIYWERLLPGRITDIFQSKPRLSSVFSPHMSALVQPPLVAQAVKRIYDLTGDVRFLKDFVPRLKRYFDWLGHNRDFDNDNLLTIISPFESGMDWKPTYDVALGLPARKADWRLFTAVVRADMSNFFRGYDLGAIYKSGNFLVKDAGFNTIYADNLRTLSALCREVGDASADHYQRLSEKVVNSILRVMYDERSCAFLDTCGKSDEKIEVITPTIFYPLVLEGIPDEIVTRVLDRHLFNGEGFDVRYPLPSVAINHPSFNPDESMYLWRGPTWAVNNWFLHQFLMKKGHDEQCKRLIDSFRELIMKSGFREYYNPFTGEGYGAENFTWSCLIVDMIRSREELAQSSSRGKGPRGNPAPGKVAGTASTQRGPGRS